MIGHARLFAVLCLALGLTPACGEKKKKATTDDDPAPAVDETPETLDQQEQQTEQEQQAAAAAAAAAAAQTKVECAAPAQNADHSLAGKLALVCQAQGATDAAELVASCRLVDQNGAHVVVQGDIEKLVWAVGTTPSSSGDAKPTKPPTSSPKPPTREETGKIDFTFEDVTDGTWQARYKWTNVTTEDERKMLLALKASVRLTLKDKSQGPIVSAPLFAAEATAVCWDGTLSKKTGGSSSGSASAIKTKTSTGTSTSTDTPISLPD